RPQRVEDDREEQPSGERRGLRERRAGFFREHPNAKWVMLLVLLALIAGAIFVWHYYSVRESTDDAQVDGHINPISARVGGTVLKVYYDDNQVVQAGALLVELDPKDYELALARAKADLVNAEANSTAAHVGIPLTTTTSSSQLVAADAAVRAADREVQASQARVQEAQANYTKLAADLKRMETLVAKDEVSRQQYDAAVAGAAAARATLEAANSNVASAEGRAAQARAQADAAHTVPEQIQVTRAKAGAAAADVDRYRAAVQMAELNLQYTKVYAPVNGVLGKRSVEPGQVIQPGQPLFSIVNLDDLWVTANFKETQLKAMHPGQKVEISIDAYGHTVSGTVESIGGATGARYSLLPPENATGNYVKVVQRIPVRIRIDRGQDPNHQLRPGMSVVPTVFIGS
ncbi:MAG TPA: HlyD family secretion protein, partial [Candidatus Limnocylindrales bacterium]|nr:HlyD family secretion protein [Candidatus Limnocylindrales bacterium]